MGTFCTVCQKLISGESMHVVKKCPICGNTDITKFVRVDEEDMDPKCLEKHQEDKKYLESRRAE